MKKFDIIILRNKANFKKKWLFYIFISKYDRPKSDKINNYLIRRDIKI